MLLDDVHQTMELVQTSLRLSNKPSPIGDLFVESLGLTDEERHGILDLARANMPGVDPAVSYLIGATNGIAYKHLIGRLTEYPIPELRLPPGHGRVFLDLGCNWGRWCFAAARIGYKVVGIDPSLGAVMAARRVAKQLGIESMFIVGDARFLPFKPSIIDNVFSYSVLQHFSREDVAQVLKEVSRVLRMNGASLIQMPTKFGLRCLHQQARRRFRDGSGFEVRYWSIPSLRKLFASSIGPSTCSVHCFFGIGLQFSDLRLMSPGLKVVVLASEFLRRASRVFRPLVWVADSIYISSIKIGNAARGVVSNGPREAKPIG